MIIATAGHVDHGKTELIRALTGVDTDRLPEEKARGLSIDLGFAYQSMADGHVVGFIDVPGHEKFIRNMLAGVGGIDLGLLVVAADDGVMPQTREHSTILDLLGIEARLVAITKIDKVTPSRIQEVREQVRTLLHHTDIPESRFFELCAPRNEGVAELRAAIEAEIERFVRRSDEGCFRLAVDRCFSLKGIGLVVTGTALSGRVQADDQLIVSPRGLSVRVRGIRAHDRPAERARAGDRCALNLVGRGVSESSVSRGDWVLDEMLHEPTDRIDVALSVLPSETRSLKHWTPVHVHHGADHLTGRVAVLQGGAIEAGETGRVQLVLDEATTAVWGDRVVVRDQSARRTLGGGRVTDPFSPKRGRARPERLAWLEGMALPSHQEALRALTAVNRVGVLLRRFQRARNLSAAALAEILNRLDVVRAGRGDDERVIGADSWAGVKEEIVAFVRACHDKEPGELGPNPRQVRLGIQTRVDDDVVDQALGELVTEGRLSRMGQVVHLPDHAVRLSSQDEALWRRVEPVLGTDGGSPPSLQQAADLLGLDKALLEGFCKRAVKAGRLVQIARNRYLTVAALDTLSAVLNELAAARADGFSAAQYRDACGLGRNFVIDLLEYYDRIGVSDRFGDVRRLRRSP